jgi:hypothetical protein
MKILNSNISRFAVLVVISISLFVLWQTGLQAWHAQLLAWLTNTLMSIFGSPSRLLYEEIKLEPTYWVHLYIDGQHFRFPQEIGSLLQPTIMILSWQIFLFVMLKPLQALRLFAINLLLFILIQVFFLIQLTGYHTSSVQKFIYELMVGSFYVIALVFVIKDNIFYPVFRFKRKSA